MISHFTSFPEDLTCPICKKSGDRDSVLMPIPGTEDGKNMQASPVHSDCMYYWASEYAKMLREQPLERVNYVEKENND